MLIAELGIAMYFVMWLITLLQLAFSDLDNLSQVNLQPIIIVSIPGLIIWFFYLWIAYASRQGREKRRIERKMSEARKVRLQRKG